MNIPTTPTYYTEKELALQKELRKLQKCYIFVNTNFSRRTEPIHVLAICEGQRRIQIPTEKLVFKNLDEILVIVSDILRHHYKHTKGNIGIWGNIVNYVYHHIDTKTYLFDTNGDVIRNQIINESKATLRLNGKNI